MNMKYMRAGWINNMSRKETYRWVCHLVRLYNSAWASYPNNVSMPCAPGNYGFSARARDTYTSMLTNWLINDPKMLIAALSSTEFEIKRG